MRRGEGALRPLGLRLRRSLGAVAGSLVAAGLAASSSAAEPQVVAGPSTWTDGECATGAGDRGGPVPASEATFDGGSPFLTLAAAAGGMLYVGDTATIRRIVGGVVSPVVGQLPSGPSTGADPPEDLAGRPPTAVDVTVSGLAVHQEQVYFVNAAGSSSAPTVQVLSVDLAEATPRIRALSPPLPGGSGPDGSVPNGLAADDAGGVYLTDSSGDGTGRLGLLGTDGAVEWVPVDSAIQSVAVDAAGERAYVAGAADHVLQVDLTASPPRAGPIGPQLSRAASKRVALDRAGGVLFVADPGSGTIEQIDLDEPDESRVLAGPGSTNPELRVAGMGVGRDAAGPRLFVLDTVHCAVLSLEPLVAASAPGSPLASAGQTSGAGRDEQSSELTTPGQRASDADPLANVSGPGAERSPPEQGITDLADSGGRLTAEDLVNQLLAGRSDGAFGGSQVIAEPDPALLSVPAARGEGLLGADLSAVTVEQGAVGGGSPPMPPPPVVPGPGPEALVSAPAAAPPPLPSAPPQVAGAPPPAHGQLNPTPGWGGASSDPAEGAPRYAMVRNDGDGLAGTGLLTGLLVLGGCSLLLALRAARRGGGSPGVAGTGARPAVARAWVR